MIDFTTVGDYARQLVLRRQNADVRARMDALVSEVGTGRRADLPGHLHGDFTALAAIERDLSGLTAFRVSAAELKGRAEAMQGSLGTVQAGLSDLAAQFISTPTTGVVTSIGTLASEARSRFETAVGALNADYAGRALFAGTATNGQALAPAADMLAALEASVAGLADAAAVEAGVRAWFAPGGGFDTVGYLGAGAAADQPIASGQEAGLSVTAADTGLRDTLAALAMGALADRPPLAGLQTQQSSLVRSTIDALLAADAGLAALRGEVGRVEADVEAAQTRNAAEDTALRLARSAMTDTDIYESATELEAVQGQLELLYAITARSANLSLVRALG